MPVTSFVGEIVMTPYTFAPRFFLNCDGGVLAISQFPTMYAVMGTAFGGNGHSTFQLPPMMGRSPMHSGTGPGLSPRAIGDLFGSERVVLTESELPEHSHTLGALRNPVRTDDVDDPAITLGIPKDAAGNAINLYGSNVANSPLANAAISYSGGNAEHENRQPLLAVRFIICADGIFPSRS